MRAWRLLIPLAVARADGSGRGRLAGGRPSCRRMAAAICSATPAIAVVATVDGHSSTTIAAGTDAAVADSGLAIAPLRTQPHETM